MSNLVLPHGLDRLLPLLITGAELKEFASKAKTLPKIKTSSRETGDIIMMGIGGFTPLSGFMTKKDWSSVCDNMAMVSGLFWPIPITLSASKEEANAFRVGEEVALVGSENNDIVASITIAEKYTIDKSYECKKIYNTTDASHPGVKTVLRQKEVNIAGNIKVFSQGGFPEKYGDLYMTPTQTRACFIKKGWTNIIAFQTRNPMHRAHEYLVKTAMELGGGVMIHSLLGRLKHGDIPAEVRTKAIAELIANYFVDGTIIQSGYPLDMRYAGPREALLHALFRQNYGCSHLIIGRDHAGIGDYYGSFDAHYIFDKIPDNSLKIKPLKMDLSFWCYKCNGMASMKTCPHDKKDRLLLSGTKLRHILSKNLTVPDNFSRPEVLRVLQEYYAGHK